MKKDNRLTRTRPLMPEIKARFALVELNEASAPLEASIFSTARSLYEFFHANGYMIWRNETIVPALSGQRGWVYAFYDKHDVPIYVGRQSENFRIVLMSTEKIRNDGLTGKG